MPETRTIEQAEHTVETVEYTEYQCPNCSQWFATDELHDVKIGSTETVLCGGCGDAVFDVDDEPEGIEDTESDTEYASTGDHSAMTTLVVIGTVLFVAIQVVNEVMQSVEPTSAEFQQATEQVVTGTVGGAFELFGVALMTVIFSCMFIYWGAFGPRY